MGGLVFYSKNRSNSFGNQVCPLTQSIYTNPMYGTHRVCVRTGTGANDIVKYGLTNDSRASGYCGFKLRMPNGSTAYIGMNSTYTSSQSRSSTRSSMASSTRVHSSSVSTTYYKTGSSTFVTTRQSGSGNQYGGTTWTMTTTASRVYTMTESHVVTSNTYVPQVGSTFTYTTTAIRSATYSASRTSNNLVYSWVTSSSTSIALANSFVSTYTYVHQSLSIVHFTQNGQGYQSTATITQMSSGVKNVSSTSTTCSTTATRMTSSILMTVSYSRSSQYSVSTRVSSTFNNINL